MYFINSGMKELVAGEKYKNNNLKTGFKSGSSSASASASASNSPVNSVASAFANLFDAQKTNRHQKTIIEKFERDEVHTYD